LAAPGQELSGEHHGRDHPTYEETEALHLRVVTEAGERVPEDELRGKVFRFEDRDEPSGYLARGTEITGQSTTLCYLRASQGDFSPGQAVFEVEESDVYGEALGSSISPVASGCRSTTRRIAPQEWDVR
jgi:hypothetical protein